MIDAVSSVALAILAVWSLVIANQARRELDAFPPEPPERPYPPRTPNPHGDSR